MIVEDDPAVARLRAAAPSWPGLAALAAARDAASRARFGRGFVELVHALHGVGAPGAAIPAAPAPREAGGVAPAAREAEQVASALRETGQVAPAPREELEPPAGWTATERAIAPAEIEEVWRELARQHGAAGRLTLVASAARPRAFIVEPGREVIAVVPARVLTPAARFAVLHELGHALAGLLAPVALPRALDEAAASYAARAMEAPAHPWHSPLAAQARARRTALAALLDEIERGAPPVGARPPWALWHDPGAQAAYVRAEQLADAWADDAAARAAILGASP